MPREDERYRNLSPTHPQYCTCVECVQQRLDGGDSNPAQRAGGMVGKLAGKAAKIGKGKGKRRGKSGGSGKAKGRSQAIGEPVRKHKANCQCATCTLLNSI